MFDPVFDCKVYKENTRRQRVTRKLKCEYLKKFERVLVNDRRSMRD